MCTEILLRRKYLQIYLQVKNLTPTTLICHTQIFKHFLSHNTVKEKGDSSLTCDRLSLHLPHQLSQESILFSLSLLLMPTISSFLEQVHSVYTSTTPPSRGNNRQRFAFHPRAEFPRDTDRSAVKRGCGSFPRDKILDVESKRAAIPESRRRSSPFAEGSQFGAIVLPRDNRILASFPTYEERGHPRRECLAVISEVARSDWPAV